jgi:hypothetical protein
MRESGILCSQNVSVSLVEVGAEFLNKIYMSSRPERLNDRTNPKNCVKQR